MSLACSPRLGRLSMALDRPGTFRVHWPTFPQQEARLLRQAYTSHPLSFMWKTCALPASLGNTMGAASFDGGGKCASLYLGVGEGKAWR